MRVKKEHLRKRGRITLYIPPEDIPFVESLIESYSHVSFSQLVINALKEKYGEKGSLMSLGGSLSSYSKKRIENMEKVLSEVAINAAKAGIDS